jgi:hypothetical protein
MLPMYAYCLAAAWACVSVCKCQILPAFLPILLSCQLFSFLPNLSLSFLFFMEIFINIFRMKNHLYLPRPFLLLLLLLLLNLSKVHNTKDQTWNPRHFYSKYSFTVEYGRKPMSSNLNAVKTSNCTMCKVCTFVHLHEDCTGYTV